MFVGMLRRHWVSMLRQHIAWLEKVFQHMEGSPTSQLPPLVQVPVNDANIASRCKRRPFQQSCALRAGLKKVWRDEWSLGCFGIVVLWTSVGEHSGVWRCHNLKQKQAQTKRNASACMVEDAPCTRLPWWRKRPLQSAPGETWPGPSPPLPPRNLRHRHPIPIDL
jgi:hypothetical protein